MAEVKFDATYMPHLGEGVGFGVGMKQFIDCEPTALVRCDVAAPSPKAPPLPFVERGEK